MAYRTVNVKPETHARLAAYKLAGLTFDDVVCLLMDEVPLDVAKERAVTRIARQEPLSEPELVEFRPANKRKRGRKRA